VAIIIFITMVIFVSPYLALQPMGGRIFTCRHNQGDDTIRCWRRSDHGGLNYLLGRWWVKGYGPEVDLISGDIHHRHIITRNGSLFGLFSGLNLLIRQGGRNLSGRFLSSKFLRYGIH